MPIFGLILVLSVAPVLPDAAHDMPLRDLKRSWRPVLSLVVVAVGLATVAAAAAARAFLPDLPWAAAIALGALPAPPDAVAALAVMRQVQPPHRIRTVLEGESLLNDASSLLVYRLAVGTVAAGKADLAPDPPGGRRTDRGDPHGTDDASLRRRIVPNARAAIDALRDEGRIGDDAYRLVEEELDWLDLSAGVAGDR